MLHREDVSYVRSDTGLSNIESICKKKGRSNRSLRQERLCTPKQSLAIRFTNLPRIFGKLNDEVKKKYNQIIPKQDESGSITGRT